MKSAATITSVDFRKLNSSMNRFETEIYSNFGKLVLTVWTIALLFSGGKTPWKSGAGASAEACRFQHEVSLGLRAGTVHSKLGPRVQIY